MKTKKEIEDKEIVEYYKGRDELLLKIATNNFNAGYQKAQEEMKEKIEKSLSFVNVKNISIGICPICKAPASEPCYRLNLKTKKMEVKHKK